MTRGIDAPHPVEHIYLDLRPIAVRTQYLQSNNAVINIFTDGSKILSKVGAAL